MNKQEFMQIWEKIYDINKEEIEKVPTLSEEGINRCECTICLKYKRGQG